MLWHDMQKEHPPFNKDILVATKDNDTMICKYITEENKNAFKESMTSLIFDSEDIVKWCEILISPNHNECLILEHDEYKTLIERFVDMNIITDATADEIIDFLLGK